jgi:hypothetical protein
MVTHISNEDYWYALSIVIEIEVKYSCLTHAESQYSLALHDILSNHAAYRDWDSTYRHIRVQLNHLNENFAGRLLGRTITKNVQVSRRLVIGQRNNKTSWSSKVLTKASGYLLF